MAQMTNLLKVVNFPDRDVATVGYPRLSPTFPLRHKSIFISWSLEWFVHLLCGDNFEEDGEDSKRGFPFVHDPA